MKKKPTIKTKSVFEKKPKKGFHTALTNRNMLVASGSNPKEFLVKPKPKFRKRLGKNRENK